MWAADTIADAWVHLSVSLIGQTQLLISVIKVIDLYARQFMHDTSMQKRSTS